MMDLEALDCLYAGLCQRRERLQKALETLGLPVEAGWYNGHYYKNEQGAYRLAHYPIPVISVSGLCDVELNLDCVSLSTKLTRARALEYPFEKLPAGFEVYGVEDYLTDYYYGQGMTLDQLRRNLAASREETVGILEGLRAQRGAFYGETLGPVLAAAWAGSEPLLLAASPPVDRAMLLGLRCEC